MTDGSSTHQQCAVHQCERRPAITAPIPLCRPHALTVSRAVVADLSRIDFCIWPGCTFRDIVADSKLCRFHLATAALCAAESDARQHTTPPPATTPTPQGRPTDGTIYAIRSGYNVKIGWTGRPLPERLSEYPPSSDLLVTFPGQRGDETRIKRRFAHLRTHGAEWFPYAPQVTEWIDQMRAQHGAPDPHLTCGPTRYQVPRPHATKPTIRPKHWVGGTGTL